MQDLPEPDGVDADRVDPYPHATAAGLDPVRLRVQPEDAQARRAEVACVVTHLEADVVGAQETAQHFLARREEAVDLGGREGRVQEEADREVRRAPPEHRGQQHEMEVVDPHPGVRPAVLEHGVGEALVDVDVALPRLRREPEPVPEVVEERPERVVADTPVEVLLLVSREEDGHEVVLLQPLRDRGLEALRHDRPRPPDPDRVAAHGPQRSREPARRRLHLESVLGQREAHGQPVARDDESVVSGMPGQRSSLGRMRDVGRYNLRARE